jgi:tripartite-type tricarboxylate transporter receptor subunit TctC
MKRRDFLHLAPRAGEDVSALCRVCIVSAALLALGIVPRIATAQTYPLRPITMNVPFAAGGPTDAVARIVAERMRASLGQPVIIENVGGADGTIGVGRVVRAAPDGYTLSVGQLGTHVLNGAAYSLQYDLLKDFEPISLLTNNPYILVANRSLPAKDLNELIAWINSNESKASVGVASTTQRLVAAYFEKMSETRLLVVPYRGAAPALQDVIAGNIAMTFDQPSNSLQQLRAGNTKAYGVTSKARLAALPETPSLDEAGLRGFDISVWNAVWAPKGTPKDVITKLNASIVASLADPGLRQRLADLGQEIPPRDRLTPEALAAYQKSEIEKWWPIMKAAGIKGE